MHNGYVILIDVKLGMLVLINLYTDLGQNNAPHVFLSCMSVCIM